MFKRKKKQKLKNYKAYFSPQRTFRMVAAIFAFAISIFLWLGFLADIFVLLQSNEPVGVVLVDAILTMLVPASITFIGWLWYRAAVEAVIVTETGIGYHGPGMDIFAKWEDVLRVEWQQRALGCVDISA